MDARCLRSLSDPQHVRPSAADGQLGPGQPSTDTSWVTGGGRMRLGLRLLLLRCFSRRCVRHTRGG